MGEPVERSRTFCPHDPQGRHNFRGIACGHCGWVDVDHVQQHISRLEQEIGGLHAEGRKKDIIIAYLQGLLDIP